ncbi:MAG: SpoIIE family protein phosphatase [Candidatus Solibacter usitatus]|nr:SpoIIE family protein phosphatase [Candidatus Solibacter usitatus]
MKALWKSLGWPERLFGAILLCHLPLLLLAQPASGLTGFLLLLTGPVVAFRLLRVLIRKAIWRLRYRLIVSYVFIAAVPLTALLTLVGMGLYVLVGQMAIYAVNAELQRYAGANVPTREELESLVPGLGDVLLLQGPGPFIMERTVQNFRRIHVPPAANRFDVEITWFSVLPFRGNNVLLVVRSRPSAVFRGLFGQGMAWQQTIFVFAAGVGIVFLVAQLISIVIGVSITRTVTAAVHNLYEGTQKVMQGEFSHRIAVRGSDQLAELSVSFNHMTGNLQRLIEVEKEKERLHSELEIAREVQGRLFPRNAPALRTLEISGVCHPARMVSGDYYDFLAVNQSRVALAIGDVAGKGISAALLMAAIQSVMRTQLTEPGHVSPAQVVSLLNRQLHSSTSPEKYATFYFGLYDDASGRLVYTNAGHLPPILVHGGSAEALQVTGTVVGVFPNSRYEEREVLLQDGDLLVAYTDGITEPENTYGVMFGEERLTELLVKHQTESADEIMARTMEAVRQWSHSLEQEDDMTMVVARRHG